jgi:dihydropyrimidinase
LLTNANMTEARVNRARDLPRRIRRVGAILLALGGAFSLRAQEPTEILIRNGLIVTEAGRLQADLRIRGGEIAEIGRNLVPGPGARTLDATGTLVLPGGIDTHVHLNPVRTPGIRPGADDFESASRAALAGGITTIGGFISQEPDVPAADTLAEAAAAAARTTIADAILHFTISDPAKLPTAGITMLRERGVTPKIFMRGMAFEQRLADNLKLLEAAGTAGLLTQFHAEDAAILAGAMDRLVAQGRTALVGQNFADSHPVAAEEVATQRAIGFAEFTGAPIYLVHMSSERAMRVAEAARARGLPVFTEVRFIYLHLTRDAFNGPDGPTFTGAPPLRDQTDRDYLWAAIARGSVDVVNTDHVGYTRAEKMDPGNSIQRPREGSNFLQDQLPLLYSEGVRKGRISLERMVAVTATNPAKLFGLYPKKGAIAVGADADVVIWDPELTRTIRDEDILSNGRFSIFAGWEVTGWPVVTIRRGQVVYENGKVVAAPGSGRLAPRVRWQRP